MDKSCFLFRRQKSLVSTLAKGGEATLDYIKARGYNAYRGRGKAVRVVGFNYRVEQKAIDTWREEVLG